MVCNFCGYVRGRVVEEGQNKIAGCFMQWLPLVLGEARARLSNRGLRESVSPAGMNTSFRQPANPKLNSLDSSSPFMTMLPQRQRHLILTKQTTGSTSIKNNKTFTVSTRLPHSKDHPLHHSHQHTLTQRLPHVPPTNLRQCVPTIYLHNISQMMLITSQHQRE